MCHVVRIAINVYVNRLFISILTYHIDEPFHHVSYGVTHSANSQLFGDWDAEENRTNKGKEKLGKD